MSPGVYFRGYGNSPGQPRSFAALGTSPGAFCFTTSNPMTTTMIGPADPPALAEPLATVLAGLVARIRAEELYCHECRQSAYRQLVLSRDGWHVRCGTHGTDLTGRPLQAWRTQTQQAVDDLLTRLRDLDRLDQVAALCRRLNGQPDPTPDDRSRAAAGNDIPF